MVTDHNHRVGGNILHGGGCFRINQSHIPVRCRMMDTVSVFFQIFFQSGDQSFIDVFAPLLPGDHGLQIFAQTGNASWVQTGLGFRHGKHRHQLRILRSALGCRVEIAHGIQFITEKFRAEGLLSGGRENIQNSAPDGELTGTFHHAAAAVARRAETL